MISPYASGKYLFYGPVLVLLLAGMLVSRPSGLKTQVVRQSDAVVNLKITLDEPEWKMREHGLVAMYEQSGFVTSETGALVPVLSRLVPLASDKATVLVLNSVFKDIVKPGYLYRKETGKQAELVELEYLGLYRDVHMHALRIRPIRTGPGKDRISYLESVSLEIRSVQPDKGRSPMPSATLSASVAPALLDENLSLSVTKQASDESFSVHRIPLEMNDPFKLIVEETGLYKVTYEELQEAEFPVDEIDPKKLRLFNKGKEIPVYLKGSEDGSFDTGDYIEFWGVKNEKTYIDRFPDVYTDPFSDKNTYWLAAGTSNGERIVEESGGIKMTQPGTYRRPYSFKETLHFEKDDAYVVLSRAEDKLHRPSYEMDHWYFDKGISAVGSKTYDFYLPYPVDYGTQVYVRAMMRGSSYYSDSNPLEGHQVSLWLNDQKVGEILPEDKWRDQQYAEINNFGGTGIAQSNLQNGNNQLLLQMDQVGVTDVVLLNWFDVTYQREYWAHEDFIKFRLQEGFPTDKVIQFEVEGFTSSDVQVYKLGISKVINATIEYVQNEQKRVASYKLTIQDEIIDPTVEYVALTESAKKKVLSITPYRPWKADNPDLTLLDPSNAADYLIITHEQLQATSEELRTLKETAGYTVEIVTTEHIYDLFNYGIKSPVAIKDFLGYAYRNWRQDVPLKYVVLTGDASYDYKDYRNNGADLVPTMMFETYFYGAAASDYWYALISGDDLIPDLTVSRIPARTNQQLLDYIAKVEQYQSNPLAGQWRNSALFISGNDDPAKSGNLENITGEPVFRAQSLRLINMKLPDNMFAHRLNTVRDENYPGGFDPEFGGKTDLIDYFNDGLSYINFLGHGGGGIWADVNLLDLNDVDRLNNDARYPFVASMTCFTGAFENPGKDGLAERLVLAGEKGAIAVLASSGLGWMQNDYTIEWGLFDYLWKDQLTFGEAVDLMKIFYMMNPVYITEEKSFFTWGYTSLVPSMVAQYNLLGDPALVMQRPVSDVSVSISDETPFPGETVTVLLPDNYAGFSGTLEISDVKNRKIASAPVTAGEGPEFQFTVPDSAENLTYNIKVYVNEGQTDAAGSAQLSISRSLIKKIKVTPAKPLVNQPVDIEIVAKSNAGIKELRCLNFRNFNTTRTLGYEIPMAKVADTLFQSVNPLPGFNTGGLKYFDIMVTTENDSTYYFRWKELEIDDPRPDLAIDAESVRYTGDNQLNLEFNILNDTGHTLNDLSVVCVETDTGGSEQVVYNNTIELLEKEEHTVVFALPASPVKPYRTYKIALDEENSIEEKDEGNNALTVKLATDRVLIDHKTGTTWDGSGNDTLDIREIWSLHIPEEGVSATTVLQFDAKDIQQNLERGKQQDLRFIPVQNQFDTTAISLDLRNSSVTFTTPALLSAEVDRSKYNAETLNTMSFFVYDAYLGLWVAVPSAWSSDRLEASISSEGLFGVFSFRDDEYPTIEITANGRPLIQDMLVTSSPALAFLLQDANGINLTGSFNLRIDGEELPGDEMSYPDSIRNPSTISILTTPKLEPGEHTLDVQVRDISGNMAEQSLVFSVSGEFDIRVFGNYPNPFQDQTIISYFINSTQPIDDFSIKIYTTSGRLIRSEPLFLDESITDDLITAANYHELIWDGTDDDGNEVANGVYFAVIKGSYKGKTVETTIKMAKLK